YFQRVQNMVVGLVPPPPQLLAIHLIIAMATPGIEQHDAAPGGRVKQAGGHCKALGAGLDGLRGMGRQLRAHACTSASISPAVALAEPMTPGTPAPGWVPAPTRARLGMSRSRLWGRNQALWVRMGSNEKAEPRWALSSSRKSTGVKKRLVTRSARRPGM